MRIIKLLVLAAVATTAMLLGGVGAEPTPETCPAGSYEIDRKDDGSPLCRLEPTGCPYGDSIPLDSPHCAPPSSPDAYAPYVPPAGDAPMTQAEIDYLGGGK